MATKASKAKAKLNEKIKCTYANCYQRFDNTKDMKRHKKYGDEHDYCHICDLDFEDWDTWAAHNAQWSGKDIFTKTAKEYAQEKHDKIFDQKKSEKIKEIGPKGEKYGALKFHNYGCKFCGEQFKTEGARANHYNAHHPVDQNIKCPGCADVFPRASGLIYHFEKNMCPKITAARFQGYLQHKEIIGRLLEDPTAMEQMALKDCTQYLEAAKDDDVGGGAALPNVLGEEEDITWPDAFEPIKPEQLDSTAVLAVEQQKWPALAAAAASAKRKDAGGVSLELTERMQALAIKHGKKVLGPQQLKIEPNPWPLPNDYKPDDPLPTKPPAWSSGAASTELFKGAKATPVTPDWELLLKQHNEKDHKTNILHHQFWNPAHEDYDAERFYDPMLEKYKCPFPNCVAAFLTPSDNNYHIAEEHAIKSVHCPYCLKVFKTYYGLVSHCESIGSRCKLTHTAKFGQAVDLFSGGFLAAGIVERPDINTDEDGFGARYMKYEATAPQDFVKKEQAGTIVGTKW